MGGYSCRSYKNKLVRHKVEAVIDHSEVVKYRKADCLLPERVKVYSLLGIIKNHFQE
jgi:hypothetical protein